MASPPKRLRWGPYDDWRGGFRSLGIVLVAAGFLAYAGAFGSSRGAMPVRFGYWLGLMTLGWAWGQVIVHFFFRRPIGPERLWLRVLASSVVMATPYSVVVGVVTRWTFHSNYSDLGDAADLLVSVFAVTSVLIIINVLVARRFDVVTSASSQPPKFLERLPLKLRGAEVWAVEAEDHYLRLHTSKGQDLILMRLSDAVPELQGIEGAQVHRSWWVARAAITDAVRGDGRATLTLKDGAEVPVSRPYARLLRQSGWL
jgi:hypothetical protein